ncbi:RNA polymerase sigma factor SigJ [Paenibacillus humicola]|uniref:RNA polymerase sigma factor SigJ n=1 Tax=Paenibacillus humicola TaxID=3110540 RepID=UPI00237C09F1|nr:RNA polymerase sigma factor SigJ [Paenibacillus humicola]
MKELYERYRMLLYTLAYQLTGSAADAEDAVQDVFVKAADLDPQKLEHPKAYLCKMVTNRCLDLLRSARRRRERYFGPWLPEPVSTAEPDEFEAVVRSDLLSYAMLVLMDRLTPAERAVFVLREALGFDYPDIAGLTGKREANCRKLMSRARGKMGISEDEPIDAEPASEEWVRRFMAALLEGRAETILSLLAEDAVIVSDGGGKAIAAAVPVETRSRALRFLLGLSRLAGNYPGGTDIDFSEINGQTGIVVRSAGEVIAVALPQIAAGELTRLYVVRNPDKLLRFQQ